MTGLSASTKQYTVRGHDWTRRVYSISVLHLSSVLSKRGNFPLTPPSHFLVSPTKMFSFQGPFFFQHC